MNPDSLHALQSVTRRRFLRDCATGMGSMALASLLDAGADPNLKDGNGLVPLSFVPQSGTKEVWDMLVKAGAKTNSTDPTGTTLLHVAASARVRSVRRTMVRVSSPSAIARIRKPRASEPALGGACDEVTMVA